MVALVQILVRWDAGVEADVVRPIITRVSDNEMSIGNIQRRYVSDENERGSRNCQNRNLRSYAVALVVRLELEGKQCAVDKVSFSRGAAQRKQTVPRG